MLLLYSFFGELQFLYIRLLEVVLQFADFFNLFFYECFPMASNNWHIFKFTNLKKLSLILKFQLVCFFLKFNFDYVCVCSKEGWDGWPEEKGYLEWKDTNLRYLRIIWRIH